jgi:hypothetical protein
MNEKLNISILLNNTIVMQGSSINLDPYSTTTGRKFNVENPQYDEGLNISYRDILTVTISYLKHDNEVVFISELNIIVLDYGELNSVNWWFYGLIDNYNKEYRQEEYRQDLVDTFNLWQHNKVFDWFSFPYNAPQKEGYIDACLIYTSLCKTIKDNKKHFRIDVSKVREYRDFIYLMSIAFEGDRGYFGHSFYTFCDCLLELYHNNNEVFKDCVIEFTGVSEMRMDDENFFEDAITEFLKYKINIVYETP